MKSFRSKPVGWRGESHRHYLAAKGIQTVPKKYFGVFVYRKSLGGKHRGDETDNERREMYGMSPIPGGDLNNRMSEEEQKQYADALLEDNKDDINEIRVTEDATDFLISRWKEGRWRSSPEEDEEDEFFSEKEPETEMYTDERGVELVRFKVPKPSSLVSKNIREGVYETAYGNAAEVTYEDGQLKAFDLDMGEEIPVQMVTKKWLRGLDE